MGQSVSVAPDKSAEVQHLLEECREARLLFERAEVDYLVFIAKIEDERETVWRSAASSFDSFLKLVGKPEVARYRNFRAATSELGIEAIKQVGVDAAVEAQRLKKVERPKFLNAVHAWSNENGGAHPSQRFAKQIRQQVSPAEVIPLPVRRQEAVEALKAENAELHRECERLRKENEKLKSQLASARKPDRK